MIYNTRDALSPYWSFLTIAQGGRYMHPTQERLLANRKGGNRDDGYGGGGGGE